jgi:methyltransferase-like protein/ubiquinone/menaquinone biosynthesis C-methylase UbiE
MENPYNQVPYHSSPFPQAHIGRLATQGVLLGIDTPDIHACRVLEVGCNDGSHLIPMAMQYPDSQFVGIDLAELPIARAAELAAELRLENISFRVADVMQLSGQRGECDYLIAHGVYSWVPAATQDKLLELCSRLLGNTGVGYVSYNCYPAWHLREVTRNMVRIHTAGMNDPVEIRNRAIALLAGIYRSQGEREPYRETIRAEMERIIAKDPMLCFHDDFAEHNNPVYFSEFMKRAAGFGLQFLAEAEPEDMDQTDFAPDVRESLSQTTDPLEREQQFDFLTLRSFRRTLVCHDDLVLDRSFPLARMRLVHYAAALQTTVPASDLVTSAPAEFTAQNGSSVTVNQPFVKVVLYELTRAWPGTMTFDELLNRARSVSPLVSTADAESTLREVLLKMYMPGLLEFSVAPYRYPVHPTEKPRASRLARHQARNGSRVTNLRHRAVEVDSPIARAILPLLDGTRDIESLHTAAVGLGEGDVLRAEVESGLMRLAELALLEA